jgi:phosphatidylinositol alpha-mannosyltransferase
VHLHAPLSPVLPVLANRATRLPLVATYHTNFGRSRLLSAGRRLAQSLVDRIDVHVAVSRASARAVAPYVRADFQVVPNGVDVGAWARGRPRREWRGAGGAVVFLGRLEPRCGLERLLTAWPLLRRRGTGVRLLVVGDGPARWALEAMAAAAGVPATFAGARWEDRADWLASADVMVCPTAIASFGVTLLEGMAAGLPIVASDIDGFREVLTHGREGWLVDTGSPPALARALGALLESPEMRRRMGAEGRATAARYDWSSVARQVLCLEAEALERHRSAGR